METEKHNAEHVRRTLIVLARGIPALRPGAVHHRVNLLELCGVQRPRFIRDDVMLELYHGAINVYVAKDDGLWGRVDTFNLSMDGIRGDLEMASLRWVSKHYGVVTQSDAYRGERVEDEMKGSEG